MFWVNPYSQRNQRRQWLNPDVNRLPTPAIVKTRSHDWQRAALGGGDADRRTIYEDLRFLSWQVKDLRAHLALRRLSFKYNPDVDDQPRDDHGRWTDKGPSGDSSKDPGLVTRPAFLMPIIRTATQSFERALVAFGVMSAGNSPDATAVLKINARVFKPGATPEDPWVAVDVLTKEEADALCPKRVEVQELVDKAAEMHKREDYPTASRRGTAIHNYVEHEINKQNDPDFRAEVSLLDSKEVTRGTLDSKRLDVFENTRKEATVCIHDEKTGKKPLSFAEMTRLVAAAHDRYEGTERVIITEVRPSK
jgi:hypothetical protein